MNEIPNDPIARIEALLQQQNDTYGRIILAWRAQERILAATPVLVALGDVLKSIIDLDPDLVPEAQAAVGHLEELSSALSRMQDFVETRLSVEIERYGSEL